MIIVHESKGWETVNTRQVIKQALFKNNNNNKAHQKNRGANGRYRFLIAIQSPVPLRSSLSTQDLRHPYFLRASAIVQGLVLFMVSSLEQACLINGVD